MIHFLSLEYRLHGPISETGDLNTHSGSYCGLNNYADCTYTIRSISCAGYRQEAREGTSWGHRTSISVRGPHSGPRIDGGFDGWGDPCQKTRGPGHKIGIFSGGS